MQFKKQYIPNLITALRILGSVVLLFLNAFTAEYFVVYSICGISDVADGTVARAMNATGDLGAKLDSIADLLFYSVAIIKISPFLMDNLSAFVWVFAAVVLLIRLASYIVAGIKYKRFASLHTLGNKLTGASVFLITYFLKALNPDIVCTIVCIIGGFASAEELVIHIKSKEYQKSREYIGKTMLISNNLREK